MQYVGLLPLTSRRGGAKCVMSCCSAAGRPPGPPVVIGESVWLPEPLMRGGKGKIGKEEGDPGLRGNYVRNCPLGAKSGGGVQGVIL